MRDLRDTESSATASSSTAPVTMNRNEESRFSRVSPLEMDWMTMIPSSAANAEPRPPNRLVPPMTAAAIALRFTSPAPLLWLAAANRAAASTPPSAAKDEHNTITETNTALTLMPARRAASALPPTANTDRPHFVRVSA